MKKKPQFQYVYMTQFGFWNIESLSGGVKFLSHALLKVPNLFHEIVMLFSESYSPWVSAQ